MRGVNMQLPLTDDELTRVQEITFLQAPNETFDAFSARAYTLAWATTKHAELHLDVYLAVETELFVTAPVKLRVRWWPDQNAPSTPSADAEVA